MKERKHSFNIVDAAVILILVAVAAFAVIRYNGRRAEESAMKVTLSYVMRADMIPEDLAETVSVGDFVYEKESRKKIGRVTDVGPESSDSAGYKILYITAEAPDAEGGDTYRIEGIAVRAGEKYSLSINGEDNRSLYCEAECISVDAAVGEN